MQKAWEKIGVQNSRLLIYAFTSSIMLGAIITGFSAFAEVINEDFAFILKPCYKGYVQCALKNLCCYIYAVKSSAIKEFLDEKQKHQYIL